MVATGQGFGALTLGRRSRGAGSVAILAATMLGVGMVAPLRAGAQGMRRSIQRRATLYTTSTGASAADSTALTEIRTMLDASAAAWNRGDLDAFMLSYAPGTGTTFIGRRGIVRGPAEIRAGYAPRFAPGYARGTLHFEQLEVDRLAPDAANAIAFYVLTTRTAAGTDSTMARGPTSLVLRRLGGGWRIVHDHSS